MLVELTKDYLVEGLPIISVTQRSNAVIVGVYGSSVKVLTDFGNTLNFDFEELQRDYKVHEEYLEGYPIDNLQERVNHQIELLTEFLGGLNEPTFH